MLYKLTTTLGLVLLGSSLAFAGQNAAAPKPAPQGNAVTAPAQPQPTKKAATKRHKGKKHHKHQKKQNSQKTTTSK